LKKKNRCILILQPISNVSSDTYIETKDGFSVYPVGSGEYNFGFTIDRITNGLHL